MDRRRPSYGPMALTIVVRSGEGTNLRHITFDAPRIVVGRAEGCEVRLPDPSVSLRHASFRQRGAEYIVLDEGSTNGTFVGGVRLSPHSPRVVKTGDLVRVGRVWVEVRVEAAMPTQNAQLATRELALALVSEALVSEGAQIVPKVRVVAGAGTGTELALEAFDRVYVVGRSKAADLDLDDADLSRRHVEIARRGDGVIVRDLGSKNGSRFDQKPLVANAETPWREGALLGIGSVRIACDDPVGAALSELERAADERMAPSELVEPPRNDAVVVQPLSAAAASDGPDEPSPFSSASSSSSKRGAQSSSMPPSGTASRPRSSRAPSSRPGWAVTDLLVALLALAVLGLSVAGLVWLIRSG